MSPKNSKKSGCGIFYKNGVGEWGIGKKDSVKKEDAWFFYFQFLYCQILVI